jgi:tRNA pseudouridine38-40 synthase
MEAPATRRFCLTLHYDGGAFYGWQLQPEERSVQGELERVLAKLFARPARVIGAGRTDRGVHATGQVAAVDAPAKWTASALYRALNALLPGDVWVSDVREAAPDFHPRYDAASRAYVYRIGLVAEARSPFHARWCWPLAESLQLDAMERATRVLVGDHSFLAFAKAGQEHRGDRCIVTEARWEEWEGLGLEFHVAANRFLHHMVRYLVGTLAEVGLGRRAPEEMARLLEPGSGLRTSPPAPPEGLFLRSVLYPSDRFGPAGPPPPPGASELP